MQFDTTDPIARRVAGQERDPNAVKLSDLVYAKIAARISSGEYPVDSRLPTENEMAEELGVSRPVVREALARLRNDGVVLSRRGSGTYVRSLTSDAGPDAPRLTSIADMRRCLEYRISVEGETAWHAANEREGNRAPLVEAMAQLEDDYAKNVLEVDHDYGFHYAVALATGNRFFHESLLAMRSTIKMAMNITPNFISVHSGDRLDALHREHRAVYDAILANGPEAARDAMRTHLIRAMNRVFEGI